MAAIARPQGGLAALSFPRTESPSISSSSASFRGTSLTGNNAAATAARRRSGRQGTAIVRALKSLVPDEFNYDNLDETQRENYSNLPAFLGGRPSPVTPINTSASRATSSAMAAAVAAGDQAMAAYPVVDDSVEPEVPKSLWGLTPRQIQTFGLDPYEDNFRSPTVKADMLSARASYRKTIPPIIAGGPVPVFAGYYGGGAGRAGGPSGAGPPPDLPSLLLNSRILYIGMPLVPAVTELLVAQLLWLQYDSKDKPIYVYINSPGTQGEDKKSVAFETEATAVADSILFMSCKVHTICVNKAIGQAAMLLACGTKGCRHSQPNAKIVLEPPRLNNTQGPAADLAIKARELEDNFINFVNIIAYKTGRKPLEVRDFVSERRYLTPEMAIEYGLIDHLLKEKDMRLVERVDYEKQLAVSQAQERVMNA